MTNLERASTVIGIIAFVFSVGAGWSVLNSRLDRVDKEIERLDDEKGESLCLTVLSRQVVAVEKGNASIQKELQGLANQHCPNVPRTGGEVIVAGHGPMTKAQLEERRAADREARIETLKKLGQIDRQLSCSDLRAHGRVPVRRGDLDYGPEVDRDGDGVGCE